MSQQQRDSPVSVRQAGKQAGFRYFQLHILENLSQSCSNNKWNLLAHITEKSKGEIWFQALFYPSTQFVFASWPCLLQCLLYFKLGSPRDPEKVAGSSQCHVSSHSCLARKTDHALGAAKYLVSLRLPMNQSL